MKLIRKHLERDTSGTVTLLPQDAEDMWYVYNIIQEGDEIETITSRKLVTEKGAPRVTLRLKVKVAKIEYYAQEGLLRVNGKTSADHKDVPLGSFHTLQLQAESAFDLYKNEWDSFALGQVEEATNIENRSDIGAVVLQPGLAHICLVTEAMTVMRAKVDITIPRKKRGDNAAQDKAMERFYAAVYTAIMQNINITKIKVILLAGPGQTPTDLLNFVFAKAVSEDNQVLVKSRAKFVTVHASSGHLHALTEALADSQVQTQLMDTRYGREMKVMDMFFKSLNNDDMRAWYGPMEVEKAARLEAIETLMLTDSLFRSSDIMERKRFVALSDAVRERGCEVLVLSSLHPSGEQLDSVSGVACILMYPLDLDDEEDEEEKN